VETSAPTKGAISMIDREWVQHWSARYPTSGEQQMFKEAGSAVAARGYYTRDEFMRVRDWKSQRSRSYLARNGTEDIEDITRLALTAPERLRHRILRLLSGVQTPMASALLTVADPYRFTVIDYRAIETLRAYDELDGDGPSYSSYRALCMKIAERTDTDLRTLDRALWQWSKEQGKEAIPDDELDEKLHDDAELDEKPPGDDDAEQDGAA
jgi:hypothetical protein